MSASPEHPDASSAPPVASVERRIVSVLFADLVGFTTLSERLDAEEVATVQDAYFASVRETVERYGGTLEKFIGDAAMAVFGVPQARDDDAERAVRAGLALVAAIEQIGARLGLPPGILRLRVGVNSGEVVHATDGPDAGRVTGDTVNTAARLQSAAEPDSVLVGRVTALAVGHSMELSEVGPIALKGKADPVAAWRVDALRPEPSRDAALGDLRAPILGRDAELSRLESLGAGRVTIVAPPGVGKSRLVAELATRSTAHGRTVLRARVRPDAARPYEAVEQLLLGAGAPARLEAALAAVPPTRRAVVTHEVDALLAPPEATIAREVAERDARFAAWDEALDALCGAGVATWIVEDVHWAGPDLLAFLHHASTAHRLIVCTARPSLLESAPEWVEGGQLLELGTLPRADAGELVRALVGEVLPDLLVAAIAERSDGNALFIEELLRTWVSVGTLVRDDAEWRLTVAPDAVVLPATVQSIYAAQLDDLPADARLVARRAAVAGRRFADAALGPLELEPHRAGLDVLRRRAFVAGPLADELAGEVYAYRHALLRDAGYVSLARVERARLHAALARWLEEGAGGNATEVAQLVAEHYAAAAESVPAIGAPEGLDATTLSRAAAEWYERAAMAALAMAAPATAIELYGRSIGLTDPGASVDLARRRLRRGRVVAESAELDAGIAEIADALETLGAALPDSHELYGEAAYALGLAYMQQIRFSEAEAVSADAQEGLADVDDPAAIARLMALHAWSLAAQGRDEGAGEEARRARAIAAAVDDAALEVDVLEHYAATNDELDNADATVWEELESRARAAGRWRQAAIALRTRAYVGADVDPRGALPLFDESAELAATHGFTEQVGWADLARGELLFVIGEWDAALQAADRAISLAERYAYERLAFRTWMVALPMVAERRDPSWIPRYERWWRGAVSSFALTPSPYATLLRAATALWIARARGEPLSRVAELPERVPPFLNPHFLAAREVVAEGLIAAGEVDRAAALAPEPDDDWTPLMMASRSLILAWAAAARGDTAGARELAREAAGNAERIGARWWVERARSLST